MPAPKSLVKTLRLTRLLLFATLSWTQATPWVMAQGPYSEAPSHEPPVQITVGRTPASPWHLEVDTVDQSVRVSHRSYPELSIEIDADGPEDDQRFEGITFIRNGLRMEGKLYNHTVPFLSPDHDAGRTEKLRVEALDVHLRIRFEGGTYRRLSAAGPDSPVFFEASFFLDKEHRLNGVFNGLYYLFPTASGSRVIVTSRHQEVAREFHPATHKRFEYFEEVLRVETEDPRFGTFHLEGLVQRLQLHSHGGQNGELFEIDLDHAFKDRGQKEVLLRFLLAAPFTNAPVGVREGR